MRSKIKNEIETQLKKIQKEKSKLKILKAKIKKEKFEKVYDIVANNFDNLNENLRNELSIYFQNENKIDKKTDKKNAKITKNADNI